MILSYKDRTFRSTCFDCDEEFTTTFSDDYIIPYNKEISGYEYPNLHHEGCPSYTYINVDMPLDEDLEGMPEKMKIETQAVIDFIKEVGKEPNE